MLAGLRVECQALSLKPILNHIGHHNTGSAYVESSWENIEGLSGDLKLLSSAKKFSIEFADLFDDFPELLQVL